MVDSQDHWPSWDRGSSIAAKAAQFNTCPACGEIKTASHPLLCFGSVAPKLSKCSNAECQMLRATVELVAKSLLETSALGFSASRAHRAAKLLRLAADAE